MSRGFRTPSFYNLYVYGYHGGVFAFQIGNPVLKPEYALDMSASLRCRTHHLEGTLTGFVNTVKDYIYMFSAPDHELAPSPDEATFVFAHDQADVLIAGLELGMKARILSWLLLQGDFSWIQSEFLSGSHEGGGLPLMPAIRVRGVLEIRLPDAGVLKNPRFRIWAVHALDKDAAGIYEPFGPFDDGIGPDIPFGVASTSSYTLLNIGLDIDMRLDSQNINASLYVNNILNAVYRDFLDIYKGYALGPGRGVSARLHVPF